MAAPDPILLRLVKGEELPAGFRVTMPLVDSAIEHGVAPLLDEAVRQNDVEGDHEALVRLAMWSMESAASTLAAEDALAVLLDACKTLDIEPAIFKGASIGRRWYPRPDLRPADDIDVFVGPSQTDRLVDLVTEFDDADGIDQAIEAMIAEQRIFEYTIYIGETSIDIHRDPWNLLLTPQQQDLIWQRTVQLALPDGRTVRTLDLEMSVVMALVHLLRDTFADLMHFYDIDLMINANPDWDFIAAFAEEEGWTDLVRFSLGLVCDVLDRPSPLPRDIGLVSRIITGILWPRRLLLRGTGSVVKSHRRQFFSSLLVSGRRRDVADALIRRIFPPRAMIDYRFPDFDGPYLLALLRWRQSQHREYRTFRSRALGFREELSAQQRSRAPSL